MNNQLIEILAEHIHDKQWCGWMEWMLPKVIDNPEWIDPQYPETFTQRWLRQSQTKYKDLADNEKESDKNEAKEILEIIGDSLKYMINKDPLKEYYVKKESGKFYVELMKDPNNKEKIKKFLAEVRKNYLKGDND